MAALIKKKVSIILITLYAKLLSTVGHTSFTFLLTNCLSIGFLIGSLGGFISGGTGFDDFSFVIS